MARSKSRKQNIKKAEREALERHYRSTLDQVINDSNVPFEEKEQLAKKINVTIVDISKSL